MSKRGDGGGGDKIGPAPDDVRRIRLFAAVVRERFRRDSGQKNQAAKRLAFIPGVNYHRKWTGGRVVECTALEMRRTCKGIVGSNPTLSASTS